MDNTWWQEEDTCFRDYRSTLTSLSACVISKQTFYRQLMPRLEAQPLSIQVSERSTTNEDIQTSALIGQYSPPHVAGQWKGQRETIASRAMSTALSGCKSTEQFIRAHEHTLLLVFPVFWSDSAVVWCQNPYLLHKMRNGRQVWLRYVVVE